jgi:hypothetical protein
MQLMEKSRVINTLLLTHRGHWGCGEGMPHRLLHGASDVQEREGLRQVDRIRGVLQHEH